MSLLPPNIVATNRFIKNSFVGSGSPATTNVGLIVNADSLAAISFQNTGVPYQVQFNTSVGTCQVWTFDTAVQAQNALNNINAYLSTEAIPN